MSKPRAVALTWLTQEPVWIEQWPLPSDKLTALHHLVTEQVASGHLSKSTSPFNSPVFVIKKKSGKWRLLHDLREINKLIQPMGPLQCGLPNPNMIPDSWELAVVDLKDCFYTIPLQPQDQKYFAFTIPTLNAERPTARYQWTVLPQGMLNSPTMCQLFVDQALQSFRTRFPSVRILHYMDDIALAAPRLPADWKQELTASLQAFGLVIAPEKVQVSEPFSYLGHKMYARYSSPVLPSLALTRETSFVQLQQYLGAINWIRPYACLTTDQLSPLFSALKRGRAPADKIRLTPAETQVVQLVNDALAQRWVDRCLPDTPLRLAIFKPGRQCLGFLFQSAPPAVHIIEWLHLANAGRATLFTLDHMVAHLITRGRRRALALSGSPPWSIVVPFSRDLWEAALATSDALQLSLNQFFGAIEYHLPKDPRIQLFSHVPACIQPLLSPVPVRGLTLFTDGGPSRGVVTWKVHSQWESRYTGPQISPQRSELAAAVVAASLFPHQPVNIITDSLYVAGVLRHMEGSAVSPNCDKNLLSLFVSLQHHLSARTAPFFVAHIRSHQPFPGFLSEGNARADSLVSLMALSAVTSHELHHQNARALAKQFSMPLSEAQAIIQQCPQCSGNAAAPAVGVNPRGTAANDLWQMDVTHFLPFAPWKFLHVVVDTYSGYVFVTPQKGESAKHVICHFVRAMAVMGKPCALKTDNGPAYCSTALAEFCQRWGIRHTFGIPYNSTGQAIVERANRTLKAALAVLKKQQGGAPPSSLQCEETLAAALFTINHLNLCPFNSSFFTRTQRHFQQEIPLARPLVRYRRSPDPTWHGPVPLITWGRGYAAVDTHTGPLWVPARLVRPWLPPKDVVARGAEESDSGLCPADIAAGTAAGPARPDHDPQSPPRDLGGVEEAH